VGGSGHIHTTTQLLSSTTFTREAASALPTTPLSIVDWLSYSISPVMSRRVMVPLHTCLYAGSSGYAVVVTAVVMAIVGVVEVG